ncbi:MAG TPA: PAS domain S-box protein [Aliidongia sp.]|nr:PAS domain S-box protein [Aliidongia sp.]
MPAPSLLGDQDPIVFLQYPGRRFQLLLESLVDYAICMLDPDGLVVSWNAGAAHIDGYTESEILGSHFSVFFIESDREEGKPAEVLRIAKEAGSYTGEALRVRKDGSSYWAGILIRSIYEVEKHVGFVRVVRDLTVQRQQDAALRESERRLRLFVESVTDYALYVIDPKGVVTSWNSGAERIKGYKAEEIIGQHFSIFFTSEDRKAGHPEEVLRIAATTGRFTQEARRVRKDGSIFAADVVLDAIYDEGGELVGFAKITRDVSERKAAEAAHVENLRQNAVLAERQRGMEQLKHTSQTLAKIVEASPLAIVTIDGDDIIRIWNPAAERIYGLEAASVVGRRWQDTTPDSPPLDQPDEPSIVDLVRRSGSVHAVETRRRRKDGKVVELSRSGALIHDDANQGSVVILAEDVTGRKETERHLRQAQKMDAIGQLTGGIAHDFNNLLAIISGNLELLADGLAADSPLHELLSEALAASVRGADLTYRLLAYSRQQQLDPTLVDLAKLTADLVTTLRRVIEESIDIETMIAPDLWKTKIDVNQLENAVINLAVNARDAMPHGGRLTLSAENTMIDQEYAQIHDEIAAGQYVVLSVSDTGTGMTADVLSRALEPFYTTKPVGRGTGLGLSMVYGFVKQSKGHLMLYSEPGHGTTVKLYLPKSSEDSDSLAAPESVAPDPVGAFDKVVLVVEDDEAVRKLLTRTLKSLGYRILEAPDGPAGLEILDGGTTIDLLLTDIVLPKGMNGVVFAGEARRRYPTLKVIFSSGYAPNAVIRDDAFKSAILLSKPFTKSVLAEAVHRALTDGTT